MVPFYGVPMLTVVLLEQMVATALVGNDQTPLDRPGVREPTMTVDSRGTGITDFDIGDAQRQKLIARGSRLPASSSRSRGEQPPDPCR